MAPVFVLLLDKYKKQGQIYKAYFLCYAIFVIMELTNFIQSDATIGSIILNVFFATVLLLVSGIFTQVLYNGKRMKVGKNFSKWFFYVFYPGHLTVLCIIRALR